MRRDLLVTIQGQSTSKLPSGQQVQNWSTFATEWANIRFLSGLEAIKAGATTSILKASINIRYREDITPAMRVTYGGKTYQIEAVLPDLDNRDGMFLACEVVNG